MPASRNARAMIFAPRSWPSSPGFAITTRILRALTSASHPWYAVAERRPGTGPRWRLELSSSEDGRLSPHAPDGPERVAHLAHRHVRARGVEDGRHQVDVVPLGLRPQTRERRLGSRGVAPRTHPPHP